jgi:hypothetical protein
MNLIAWIAAALMVAGLIGLLWPQITANVARLLIDVWLESDSRVPMLPRRLFPDRIIAGDDPRDPFLYRWWLIPKNPWFNVYLHRLLRDDDDRALHDHPWWNVSWLLRGGYVEVTPNRGRIDMLGLGRTDKRTFYGTGALKLRGPKCLHRLERSGLHGEAWSLFITGPVVRQWGFMCPKGWVSAKAFNTKSADGRTSSTRGCE